MMRRLGIYLLILLVSISLNFKWLKATFKNEKLGLEEGWIDYSTIRILSSSQNLLWNDMRTFGQPSESSPYSTLSITFLPIIINKLIHNTQLSYVFAFVIFLFLAGIVCFELINLILNNYYLSFIFSITYVVLHPLLYSIIFPQGHLRLLNIPFLVVGVIYFMIVYSTKKKILSKIVLLITLAVIYFIFTGTNVIIFILTIISSFIIIKYLYSLSFREILHKFLLVNIIFGICIIYIFLIYNFYQRYFSFEGFTSQEVESNQQLLYTQMSDPVSFIFLNWGSPSRAPSEFNSLSNPLLNLIYSLPFFIFLTFFGIKNFKRKWIILAWVLILDFLACGVFGPFKFIFTSFNLPFRAPGRIFLPVSYIFLIIFGSIGMKELIKNIRIKFLKTGLFVISIVVLLTVSFYISIKTQYVYEINPQIEEAYSHIPRYSRVLLLPLEGMWRSLSKEGVYKYQPYPTVGFCIMHLHDYLCSKYQLKSSYTCASQYQIPSLIEWFFLELLGRRQWNIISEIGKLDWNDFFEYIKLIPNLEYIVIYKKILPYSIKQALMHNKYVEIYFNNEYITVLKIKNSLHEEIIGSNMAFVVEGSPYSYIHLYLKDLLKFYKIEHPIIFEDTQTHFLYPLDKNLIFMFMNIDSFYNLRILPEDLTLRKVILGYTFTHLKGFSSKRREIQYINGELNFKIFLPLEVKYILIKGDVEKFVIEGHKFELLKHSHNYTLFKVTLSEINKYLFNGFIKGNKLHSLWMFNFNPQILKNIRIYKISKPRGYWSQTQITLPSSEIKYLLLCKSYFHNFEAVCNGKTYPSYIANMILNGFSIPCASKKIKIRYNPFKQMPPLKRDIFLKKIKIFLKFKEFLGEVEG